MNHFVLIMIINIHFLIIIEKFYFFIIKLFILIFILYRTIYLFNPSDFE